MPPIRLASFILSALATSLGGVALAQQGTVPESALRGPVFAVTPRVASLTPAYIDALQRSLPHHGYPTGPVTGQLDPMTEAAILAYQRDAGLPLDARSDAALQATVNSVSFARPAIYNRHQQPVGQVPAAPPGSPTTSPGGDIARAQERLRALGYDVAVTGVADGPTQRAVKAFQAEKGVLPTGAIDAALLDLLSR
jgi:peptidoglycan hydrolase-like protein with peptidoglycan-binding domain